MFSGLVTDYLQGQERLRPFYGNPPSMKGLKKAMEERSAFPTDRALLQRVFQDLYKGQASREQEKNISLLSSSKTFTVCTAHQPNIFTGYLYFVYKILHAVRLAAELKQQMPDHDFVPVYYMGSEDNDLDELGQVQVDGVKLRWNTKQQGAVGRMKVDKALLQLITQLEGQLGVQPYGRELISILRSSYSEGSSISASTFRLVNSLFARYGLLVLIAEDAELKRKMIPVFRDDLLEHKPRGFVENAGKALEQHYKMQVNPREINLFYLDDGSRDRIILSNGHYTTESGAWSKTSEEILQELEEHPERFSPNVVLRALFQETVMPNIAFIGGGAEVAYWMEMKSMFDHYGVPFPVLVLRNSFLISHEEVENKLSGFGFRVEDLFLGDFELMNRLVRQRSEQVLDVNTEEKAATALFDGFRLKAAAVDHTLVAHIDALHTRLQKQISEAGKKLLRAEKRKFEIQARQLQKIRAKLFPGGGLQERVENFMPFYAQYGEAFVQAVYDQSPALAGQFIVMTVSSEL